MKVRVLQIVNMTSVTTLETFSSPMIYNSSNAIVASITDNESTSQHYRREMHDEGIVFNDEMAAYSENEEDMSPLEDGPNDNEFYEEDEEYYVEALPGTNSGPSSCNLGANTAVITATVTTETCVQPVKKRRRRRTVPPEVKKDNHKERERARRNLIKDRFAYLRATIPTLGENAHKMARTEVLDHVIDYIQFMRNRNQNHMIEIENLRVSNVNIEEQTKGLAMALKCGYRLGGYMEPNNGEIVIDGVLPDSSVLLGGMQVSAFDVDSQTSSVDSAIREPNPIIEAPVGKVRVAPQRQHVDQFHGTHALVQQHPIDEFYEQGGFENYNVSEEQQYHAHMTESSVVISGSVNDLCLPADESRPTSQSVPETPTTTSVAVALDHEQPVIGQPKTNENSSEKMLVKAEIEPENAVSRNDEVVIEHVVMDNNQMYELKQSVHSVLIPTNVNDNMPIAGTASSSGVQLEANRSSLDLDVVFGYESPEEELIMLSELKDEMALNGKKQKQTKPRKPRTSKKQQLNDQPAVGTSASVEKTAPRPRGRPKKVKEPERSTTEVLETSMKPRESEEEPRIRDGSVSLCDMKSKKAPKRRKSSRLSESMQHWYHSLKKMKYIMVILHSCDFAS